MALGYCWAEYFLHLHGEDANGETATSSPGLVFDHAPLHDFQSDFGAGFANGFGDGIENVGAWNGWIVGEGYRQGKRSQEASRREELSRISDNDRGVYSKIDGNGFGNERVNVDNGEGYRRGKRSYGASRRGKLLNILDSDRGVFVNDIENETRRGWIIGVDNGEGYRSNKRSYESLGILDEDRSVHSKIEGKDFGNETWNKRIVANDGNYRRSKRSYDARRDGSLEVLTKNRDVYSKIDENAFENNLGKDGFGDGIENGAWNEWIKRSYGSSKRKDGSLEILDESVHSRIVENDFGDEGRNDRAITTNNNRKYRGNKIPSYDRKEEEILKSSESKDHNGVYSKIVKELVSGDSMSDESVLNFGDKKVFDDVRGYDRGKQDETLNFTKEEDLFSELAKKHGSSTIASMENGRPTAAETSSPNPKINLEPGVTRLESNKRNLLASILSEKPAKHEFPGDLPFSNKQRAIEQISRTIVPRLTASVKKFPALDSRFEADHANLRSTSISRSNRKNENPANYERPLRDARYSSGIPSSTKEIVSSRIPGNDFAPGRGGGPVPTRETSVERTTKFGSNGVKNSGGDGEEEKLWKAGTWRLVDPEGEEVWDGVGRERREAEEGERRQPSSGVRRENGKVKTKDERKTFDDSMRGCRKGDFSFPIVPSSSANEERQGDRLPSDKPWKKPEHGSVSRFPEEIAASNSSLEKGGASMRRKLASTRRWPVWRGNLRRKRDANNDRTTRGASSPCNPPASFREIRGPSKEARQPGRDVRIDGIGETPSKRRHDRRDAETFSRHRGIRTASLTPDGPRGAVYSRMKNSSKDGRGKKRGGGPRGEEDSWKESSGDIGRDNWWYRGGENVVDDRKSRIRGLLGGGWLPPPVVAYHRFTEDYGLDRSRWRAVDQGRRSSKAEARGLDRGDTALFYLRQAFMGFLRALGFFVNVGRQLMDYVESNGALSCTKDYLVGKAIHWIDS